MTTGVADAIPVVIDSVGQLGTISSSRRFKEDIRDMGDATDRLLQLRAVLFRYKQEVAKIFPELVVFDKEGKPYTVRYHILSSMLLNDLQKQHARVEAQEALAEAQTREFEALRREVEELWALEARLEAIESRAPPGSSQGR